MFTKMEALPGESFYTQVPTHWLRDPRLTATAKAVLSYWQSHAIGYRVTIEQTIAEMREGKSAIYAAVAAALELGYLKRHQGRTEDGRRLAAVEYTLGPAAYAQQYARAWGAQPADEPAQATPDAPGEDVSPGQSASRFSGSRESASTQSASTQSARRESARRGSTTKKDQSSEDQSLGDQPQNPPPPPREPATAAGDDQAVTQGGSVLDEETREILNAAVDRAVTERAGAAGWTAGKVRGAVREQLDAGADPNDVIVCLGLAARDKAGTAYPGRLAWWLADMRRQDVPAAGAPGDVDPAYRHRPLVPPGAPRCGRHLDQPAGPGCRICPTEQPEQARLDRDEARRLARLAVASKRTTNGRSDPGTRATEPSPFAATLARLDQEIAKLRAGDQQAPADLAAAS